MTKEEILSDYMQQNYSDDQLAALLAHTEDNKLSLFSCCCFIGITTADHALRGETDPRAACNEPHYIQARNGNLIKNQPAEVAFKYLGETDEERREKLIPLIHAEMDRRSGLRSESLVLETVSV